MGFALENFDGIGRWRVDDEGDKVDASGVMPSGEAFSGPQGLKALLLGHSDEFARSVLERLLTYALGRELDARDQPAVRDIIRSTRSESLSFLRPDRRAVVKSVPFQMRQTKEQ